MGVDVYIEENYVVVQQGTTKITLNLSQSQMLAEELNTVIEKLTWAEEKKKNRVLQLRMQQEELCSHHPCPSQEIFSLWNQGQIRKSLEDLAPAQGAHCFSLDDEGWALVRSPITRHGAIGLCVLLALNEAEPFLMNLWEWGSFDEVLVESVWDIAPDQVPPPLMPRLMPIVSQECFLSQGRFLMGGTGMEALPNELPQREVIIPQSLYVTRLLCTQLLYWMLMDTQPSHFIGALRPVENISWREAVEFCNRYSDFMGYERAYHIKDEEVLWNREANGYRLLTEAEWEYCARGGEEHLFSGSEDPNEIAWFSENSQEKTHRVGSKKPNLFHLFDMTGNVWEWVFDGYQERAYHHLPEVNPVVLEKEAYRVCRGGGYTSSALSARVSIRGAYEPVTKSSALGFRMARNATKVDARQ